MNKTIQQEYAEQTANELSDKPFVSNAVVDENHKGVYVNVIVPDASALTKAYGVVDNYAIWIEVEQE